MSNTQKMGLFIFTLVAFAVLTATGIWTPGPLEAGGALMIGMAEQLPTRQFLQRTTVGRGRGGEAFKGSLYDTATYAQAGQVQLSFFQTPVGQSSKTYADTNMELAGMLPQPNAFHVKQVGLLIDPGVDLSVATGAQAVAAYLNDVEKFAHGGYLELTVSDKVVLRDAPLIKFPFTNHLGVAAAIADTTTAAATSQTRIAYATLAGAPYKLEPTPITIVPGQAFKLTLNWPAAVALSAAATVKVSLGGIWFRNA